jgi:hypothetical protein
MDLCPADMYMVFDDPARNKIMSCDSRDFHGLKITEEMQSRKPLWGMANALQADLHIVFLMSSIPHPGLLGEVK